MTRGNTGLSAWESILFPLGILGLVIYLIYFILKGLLCFVLLLIPESNRGYIGLWVEFNQSYYEVIDADGHGLTLQERYTKDIVRDVPEDAVKTISKYQIRYNEMTKIRQDLSREEFYEGDISDDWLSE